MYSFMVAGSVVRRALFICYTMSSRTVCLKNGVKRSTIDDMMFPWIERVTSPAGIKTPEARDLKATTGFPSGKSYVSS